jgi:hypothetical protein
MELTPRQEECRIAIKSVWDLCHILHTEGHNKKYIHEFMSKMVNQYYDIRHEMTMKESFIEKTKNLLGWD